MKVFARQVPPEYQDSSYFFEDDFLDYVICGNDRLGGVNADLAKQIEKAYDNEYEVICDKDGKPFSDEQMAKLKECYSLDAYMEAYLSAYYGKPYDHWTIRGCCQGDWNVLYAPADMTREEINTIETMYFNLGTEVIIHDGKDEIDKPEDACGYSMYLTETRPEDIKKRIAEETGCQPEEVMLWMFDGWKRMPKYKEAE